MCDLRLPEGWEMFHPERRTQWFKQEQKLSEGSKLLQSIAQKKLDKPTGSASITPCKANRSGHSEDLPE